MLECRVEGSQTGLADRSYRALLLLPYVPSLILLQLSAYLILSALSHACPLSDDALSAMLKAVGSCARRVSSTQALRTMASICAAQQIVEDKVISKNLVRTILKLEWVLFR